MKGKSWLLAAATGAILIGSLLGVGCKSSSTNANATKTAQAKETAAAKATTAAKTPSATGTKAASTATGPVATHCQTGYHVNAAGTCEADSCGPGHHLDLYGTCVAG
jgi:hypothetical protein